MSDLAFSMQGVGRNYEHFALQDINLELPTGGIMGLIGPNGAGKSTIIRILMGLVGADQGQVEVLGQPIPANQVQAKTHIGYASEDMRLYKNATLNWHMDFMAHVFPEQWDQKYANKLLRNFDLIAVQKIKGMSHGQRVKSALLLILARHPQLLILDEPTTGLDPVARKEVLNEMMAVLADESRSVLFSSHNTQDVEQLSDQITFIDRGQLVSSNDRESYLESWRRVRVLADAGHQIQLNDHIKEVIHRGKTANLVIKDFNEAKLAQLEAQGAKVQQVNFMSLEEIFVAEVEAKRNAQKQGGKA